MSDAAASSTRPGGEPGREAVVDVGAVLAALQDQIDDLTATVDAQQRTIDELVRAHRVAPAGGERPAGTRNGTGGR